MNQSQVVKNSNKYLWDKASIYVSAACAIHCLITPVLIALAPSFSVFGIEEHTIHIVLVAIIIPMSLVAVYTGCQKHKNLKVLAGVGIGLTLLLVTAFIGHDVLGDVGEKIGTVMASLTLIASHIYNFRLCRKVDCQEC